MPLDRLLARMGWRPAGRVSKFIAYFQLLEACGQAGCPVCRCLREATLRALDALLYEQVTDPETRELLDQSWGFCAWHAWMAQEVRNAGLGMALIYQDLLARVRERLSASHRELTASPLVTGWRRLFRPSEPIALVRAQAGRRHCPLCQSLGPAEASYLHTVLEYLEDPEFEAAYARAAGLCLPHVTLALTSFPADRGASSLLGRTLAKLDKLAQDLGGFIDKHDYRKHARFTDREAAAWTGAVGFLVGQPGVFGHEIPRRGEPPPADPLGERPSPGEPTEDSPEALREQLTAVAFEKERLEWRLQDLMKQLGDESSRAAALHYRLWSVSEDRKGLEMNLTGERAAARTWESIVKELRAENERLKSRLLQDEKALNHRAGQPSREPVS